MKQQFLDGFNPIGAKHQTSGTLNSTSVSSRSCLSPKHNSLVKRIPLMCAHNRMKLHYQACWPSRWLVWIAHCLANDRRLGRIIQLGFAALAAHAAAQACCYDAKHHSSPTVGTKVHNDDAEGVAKSKHILDDPRTTCYSSKHKRPSLNDSNILWNIIIPFKISFRHPELLHIFMNLNRKLGHLRFCGHLKQSQGALRRSRAKGRRMMACGYEAVRGGDSSDTILWVNSLSPPIP